MRFIITLILFFPFCTFGQEGNLRIENEFIFGKDQSLRVSEYLGQVNGYVTDDTLNLYVIESMTQEIKVFDKEGYLIRKIGKRGRGPGEFLRLNNIALIDNLIYAFDPVRFRINIFNLEGVLLGTLFTHKESQVANFFKQIKEYDKNNLLIFYRQWGEGQYSKFDKDEIFHIWKKDFTAKEKSFGSFEGFNLSTDFAKIITRTRGGSIDLINKETIVVSPYIYNGLLYKYKKNGNDWFFEETINGVDLDIKAYEEVDDQNDPEVVTFRSFGNMVQGKYNVIDAGLYQFKEKYLVHFIMFKRYDLSETGEKWEFGVELFNISGEFLSYSSLDVYDAREVVRSERIVDFKDRYENFYMLFGEQGENYIKRFSLEFERKEGN
ncbi:MAG: 6-bladed beta-propeller [Balneolaceae bacterium]